MQKNHDLQPASVSSKHYISAWDEEARSAMLNVGDSNLEGHRVVLVFYHTLAIKGARIRAVSGTWGGSRYPGMYALDQVLFALDAEANDVTDVAELRGQALYVDGDDIASLDRIPDISIPTTRERPS